jgi:miniconductance mechanosensitive channel
MTIESIQNWLDLNPSLAPWALGGAALILGIVVFAVARFVIARGLVYLSRRTETKYDDIVVDKLRPFRFAWIAPLVLFYFLANLIPEGTGIIRQIVLFLILWLMVLTLNSLLNAANAIYEASHFYRGEPIQGYLDLVKIILALAAIIISISLFTGQSVVVLLGGLGAAMAVLLLLFRDTLLSFVASIQIQSNDLIKEGDWLEVPSFGADGEVVNMALHTVSVQNWDKTLTMIPTYKLMEIPYKNWRGMEESGGRRIKRSIHIDLNSIRFCDEELIERFKTVDLLKEFIETRLEEIDEWNRQHNATPDDPVEGRQITNIGVFQAYVTNYLKGRPDLHQEGMTLLVRQLAPGLNGLPLEVYGFAKTTAWAEYEAIQAEIFDHLLAALPEFGLRLFQQPSGLDFQALASGGTASGQVG